MILRIILAALLTLASIASAWAHCRVGASFERAMSDASTHHADMTDHHDKGDCGKSAPRACDAMVQGTAPLAPAAAPPAISVVAAAPLLVAIAAAVPVAPFARLRVDRPPDRIDRFNGVYAKTGRFLV